MNKQLALAALLAAAPLCAMQPEAPKIKYSLFFNKSLDFSAINAEQFLENGFGVRPPDKSSPDINNGCNTNTILQLKNGWDDTVALTALRTNNLSDQELASRKAHLEALAQVDDALLTTAKARNGKEIAQRYLAVVDALIAEKQANPDQSNPNGGNGPQQNPPVPGLFKTYVLNKWTGMITLAAAAVAGYYYWYVQAEDNDNE